MSAYYNEVDPYAASYLRNLIAAGLIPPGEVDERDIRDVVPTDLVGFTQCHFFAGIGVWARAFRLAGWPDDRPGWTGSCPCQPFSKAGRGEGAADERHLWPAWFHLIRVHRPRRIAGEQVADKDGRAWLDLVCSDLEASGYAVGALNLPAAGFGAPHVRQRNWLAAAACGGPGEPDPDGLVDAIRARLEGLARNEFHAGAGPAPARSAAPAGLPDARRRGPVNGFWADADWISGRDGRWRPVEPGSRALVDGPRQAVQQLRTAGNAITLPVAVEFVRAMMEIGL